MTFPTIRPALTLDFQKSRKLDPRITFSRSSSATYVDPATGLIKTAPDGVARFEKEGLLIEEARTNLFTNSDSLVTGWAIDTSAWIRTANATTAPDGTNTATKLVPKVGINNQAIYQTIAVTAGTTYTGSAFVKAGEMSKCRLSFYTQSNTPGVTVDMASGTIQTVGNCTGSIRKLSNGWYHVSMTWDETRSVSTKSGVGYDSINSPPVNGTDGFYVWGAQLEEGSFPTSYIPTAGATATRAADVASITGTNFSGWYNQSEGTFHLNLSARLTSVLNNDIIFSANNGSSGDRVLLQWVTTTPYWKASGTQVATSPPKDANNVIGKYGLSYDSSGISASTDGNAVVTATAGTVPPADATTLNLFAGVGGSRPVGGHISRLTYYPERVSDPSLQELTS